MNEFTPQDRAALQGIGRICERLDERTENMEKRLDGHGDALRSSAAKVGELEVKQGKCSTRWKISGRVGVSLGGTVIAGLVGWLFF